MSEALVLWSVTGLLLAWMLFQAVVLWCHRRLVMWDEEHKCWRAAPRLDHPVPRANARKVVRPCGAAGSAGSDGKAA